ncbi:MAG: diguanylate cyclase, partial [Planctomycetota bacterium]
PDAKDAERRIRHPKILIVEDDADQQQLISEVLCIHFNDPEGKNISAVGTAKGALQVNLPSFDVVLLDYYLPDMDGLDLLGEILSRAAVPVIFVTGANDSKTAAAAIRKGAQDYITKLGDYLFALPLVVEKNIRLFQIQDENERLQARLKLTLQELKLKNLQLEQAVAAQRMMAETDPLTGLANRRRFAQLLEHCHSEATRYEYDLTCCMCDLDHYKELNDTLGHQLGDKVLTIAAEVVAKALRKSDIAARYGGDEFVVLLPHTSVEEALIVGERIRSELVDRTRSDSQLARSVTISIGVASLGADNPTSGDALVSMSDKALYVAKERGKDQIVAFNQISSPTEQTPTSP